MGFIAVACLAAALFAAVMLWPAEMLRFVRRQWPGIAVTAILAAGVAGAAAVGLREKEREASFGAWPGVEDASRASPAEPLTAPSVASLIVRLEARLAGQPDDAKGWALLAQSYAYVGNDDAAERALAKAVDLGEDGAALDARLEAARRSGGHFGGTPQR